MRQQLSNAVENIVKRAKGEEQKNVWDMLLKDNKYRYKLFNAVRSWRERIFMSRRDTQAVRLYRIDHKYI